MEKQKYVPSAINANTAINIEIYVIVKIIDGQQVIISTNDAK